MSQDFRTQEVVTLFNKILSENTYYDISENYYSCIFSNNKDVAYYKQLNDSDRKALTPLMEEILRTSKKLSITFFTKTGRGIISGEKIAKGEHIVDLVSKYSITLNDIVAGIKAIHSNQLNYSALQIFYDIIQVGEDTHNIPTNSIGFLLNHSCDPNALLRKNNDHYEFIAIKNILPGEEVRWNYSTSMGDWYVLQCKCDSDICLGIATGARSFSIEARELILKQFGEQNLFPHVVEWLKSDICPVEFTGEKYIIDFDGDENRKFEILTTNPYLHPEVKNRVMQKIIENKNLAK